MDPKGIGYVDVNWIHGPEEGTVAVSVETAMNLQLP
jgi:hypothetical protein